MQQEAHSGLEPVAEEGSDSPPKMNSDAGCLLFVLGLESAGSIIIDAIPTGECLITAYHYFEIPTRSGPVLSHGCTGDELADRKRRGCCL